MRSLLSVMAALALNGCAAATLYVQQHAVGIAAAGAVAATVASGEQALINADELFHRAKRDAEGGGK